jgi:hypothetical protein
MTVEMEPALHSIMRYRAGRMNQYRCCAQFTFPGWLCISLPTASTRDRGGKGTTARRNDSRNHCHLLQRYYTTSWWGFANPCLPSRYNKLWLLDRPPAASQSICWGCSRTCGLPLLPSAALPLHLPFQGRDGRFCRGNVRTINSYLQSVVGQRGLHQ